MLRWGVRVIVFVAAFGFGSVIAAIHLAGSGLSHCVVNLRTEVDPSDADTPSRPFGGWAIAPKGIRIMYAGLGESDRNGELPTLRFVIYNGLDQSMFYFAKASGNPNIDLYVEGKEVDRVIGCGNGYKQYQISPRASAEVYLSAGQLLGPIKRDGPAVAQIYLDGYGQSNEFSSEPFLLPDEFRRAVRSRQ